MSLKIYRTKDEIPNGIRFVNSNDAYFNGHTQLNGSELESEILRCIDKARYNSAFTFIGRDVNLGALNIQQLSTGTKTLLNILSNPDVCFNVVECGSNALRLLPLVKDGHILWRTAFAPYSGDALCDISYHDKEFSNFYEFMRYAKEG